MKKYHNLPKNKFIGSEMSPNIYFFEISVFSIRHFLLKTKKEGPKNMDGKCYLGCGSSLDMRGANDERICM